MGVGQSELTAELNPACSFTTGMSCDLRKRAVQSQLGTVLQNTMTMSLGRLRNKSSSCSEEEEGGREGGRGRNSVTLAFRDSIVTCFLVLSYSVESLCNVGQDLVEVLARHCLSVL